MLVTIFTPLYNREKSIRAVYDSLCAQTNKDFEWLVMNDGSTDGSGDIMNDIIKGHDGSFPIRYYVKDNEGLMRTINKALDLAEGTLFCRLDSDDFALPNAVQLIHEKYPLIKDVDDVCAIAFRSLLYDGTPNGYHPFNEDRAVPCYIYRQKYHALGDRSEVVKLDVYRNYRFPEFEGEKFISEGVVWHRMAQKYKTLYVSDAIYCKGFEDDTITAKIYDTLKKCCKGSALFYYEMLHLDIPYFEKLKATIKYYRFAFFARSKIFSGIPASLIIPGLPAGLLVIFYDFIKHNESFRK